MDATCKLEIEVLEQLVMRGWDYLNYFSSKLQQERDAVQGFIDEYMSVVEKVAVYNPYFDAATGSAQDNYFGDASASKGNVTDAYSVNHDYCAAAEQEDSYLHSNIMHEQQKLLYRQIVKKCHPDIFAAHPKSGSMTNRGEYADKMRLLQEVNDAYADGNGRKLCAIALQLIRKESSEKEYLAYLRKTYKQLAKQISSARVELEKLQTSADYQLKQKLVQANNSGVDLMRYIIRQLVFTPQSVMQA